MRKIQSDKDKEIAALKRTIMEKEPVKLTPREQHGRGIKRQR
jgi:hypothetical protein